MRQKSCRRALPGRLGEAAAVTTSVLWLRRDLRLADSPALLDRESCERYIKISRAGDAAGIGELTSKPGVGKLAMGIDQYPAVTLLDVLPPDIQKQRRFADA